ncbi:DUF3472 domain-containing protein [Burkholderia cenocepacia]|nr:DUF3472 domain-containing protein [Burkholderia cenocepacia]RQV33865.1 DUF3472 domain-containing protein [Burkholderia cenocepacia]
MSFSAHAQQNGETPGTSVGYTFPSGIDGFDTVDFSVAVEKDPGELANTFWSNTFRLVGAPSGYVGFQSNGGDPRVLLVSIWGALEAKPGSPGSYCLKFEEAGAGYSCRMRYAWQQGHTYQFHLTYEAGNWLSVVVRDETNRTEFTLGRIRTAASKISPEGMRSWVEYFEWGRPAATCIEQPYSMATFGLPAATTHGNAYVARITDSSRSEACKDYSRVTVSPAGSVQENGVGNSIRGAVVNSGLCLTANGAGGGATVVLSECVVNEYQGWVVSENKTIATLDSYCLTESAGVVKTASCHGEMSEQHWSRENGQLKNGRSGSCLIAYGQGQKVGVGECKAGGAQQWQIPAVM